MRWKIGDAAFFQALRNYLNDPNLRYGYAKTPNLKAHFEATSGQNLTTFFDQWYYKQGYPTYQVSWHRSGKSVVVKINQTTSHASVSFFQMPVPIKFSGSGFDTTLVFNHTFSGQTFTVPINFLPTTATFDPEIWLISGNSNTMTYDAVNLNLKVFIQSYYRGNSNMTPVLYNNGITTDQTLFDTVTVELRNQASPHAIVSSVKTLVGVNGTADVIFPKTVLNGTYYIAIRHRNSLKTWSKNAVLFNSTFMNFDFTKYP